MNTIDIRTTQNVTIEYELASLRERILGYLVDSAVYFISAYFISMFLLLILNSVFPYGEEGLFMFFGFLLQIGGWVLYHLLFEIFNKATVKY